MPDSDLQDIEQPLVTADMAPGAAPGVGCWPALHFFCWKLRLTYLKVNMAGSDLLCVQLERLEPIEAELEGGGTAVWKNHLGWGHGPSFP